MGDSHYWIRSGDAHYYNKPREDLDAKLESLGAGVSVELELGDDQDADPDISSGPQSCVNSPSSAKFTDRATVASEMNGRPRVPNLPMRS